MAHTAINLEAQRLRGRLAESEPTNPIDVAIVEALSCGEVDAALGSILDGGAAFTGSVLSSAGSTEGVALVTFETEWLPGSSRQTLPDQVSVLVELDPPKVLKVERHPGETGPAAGPFCYPPGPAPIAISGMSPPRTMEVLAFLRESARSTEEWLAKNNINIGQAETMAGTFPDYSSTGTKCTSLLCAENSSDDTDYAD